MKARVLAVLLACFAASQTFAGIGVELPKPVAVSGTGVSIATSIVADDQVLVTVKPTDPAEIAHYGITIGFNPAEYRFVETRGVSVSRAENGRVVLAGSYIFNANGPAEDMGVILRKTSREWGRLEPQGLEAFTRNRERRVYEPTLAFTPNPGAPKELALYQNYPNPFNPGTEIGYTMPTNSTMELVVYNLLGQKVRTLASGQLAAGNYVVAWDATDNAGQAVSAGVYFYQLRALGQTVVRRMILAK